MTMAADIFCLSESLNAMLGDLTLDGGHRLVDFGKLSLLFGLKEPRPRYLNAEGVTSLTINRQLCRIDEAYNEKEYGYYEE
jgi:hypothetical protein